MDNSAKNKQFLSWRDIAMKFGCGRSKALLLMNRVGVVYVGKTAFVKSEALDAHLERYGEIVIDWPKKQE